MNNQSASVTTNSEVEYESDRNKKLQQPKKKIAGIEIPFFLGIAAIVLIGAYLEILPNNIASGFAVTMVLGGLLLWIGDNIPVFNTFGGGPLLCILIPALFIYWGILPESIAVLTDNFYNEIGFAEVVVTGLIVGSILSMDRKMLMKSGVKFLIPLLTGVACALIVGGELVI